MNTPYAPNTEGATQCVVRWMVDTPAGWLGAYDKAAFGAYTAQARADLEAEVQRLREALTKAANALEGRGAHAAAGRAFDALEKQP